LVPKAKSVIFDTSSLKEKKLQFKKEWQKFQSVVEAVQNEVNPGQSEMKLVADKDAYNSFILVFTTPHVDEKAFQSALLGALRETLGEACSPTRNDAPPPASTNVADAFGQPLRTSKMITEPSKRKHESEAAETGQPTKRRAKSKQTEARDVTHSTKHSSTDDSIKSDGKVSSQSLQKIAEETDPHNVTKSEKFKTIWLKNLNIGFTIELSRQQQGFRANYRIGRVKRPH
jgi:hypothetical protein